MLCFLVYHRSKVRHSRVKVPAVKVKRWLDADGCEINIVINFRDDVGACVCVPNTHAVVRIVSHV